MFENLVAIDIGTSSVKALAVRTGLRDFQIRCLLTETIDMEREDRAEAVKQAILALLEDESLQGCRFISMVPVDRAIIRNITFPFSDLKKIAEAVPFEAEENIPFPMEDMIVDFQPQNNDQHQGRIMIAAVRKQDLADYLAPLADAGISPFRIGLESNALFECYRYFNTVDEENVMQLHVGCKKSVINVIISGKLMYTRSIACGSGTIVEAIADTLKTGPADAEKTFLSLNLDLMSFDNNVQRGTYKTLGIAKPGLRSIFAAAEEMVATLVDEINLTVRAFHAECGEFPYNRVLISGGGSGLTGMGSIISREMSIPVVAHPFLENHREDSFSRIFQPALGAVLAYLNKKNINVDFLKHEFASEAAQSSRRMYFLAAGFGVLTILVLIVNILSSMIMSSNRGARYDELLRDHYKRYFRVAAKTDNPLAEATKLLNKEKKELKNIEVFISHEETIMDMLRDILVHFPENTNFTMKNMVINERIIRIDGTISSSQAIDDFKEKIKQSGKYDSVTMNIKSSRKDEISFHMTIKLKLTGEKDGAKG